MLDICQNPKSLKVIMYVKCGLVIPFKLHHSPSGVWAIYIIKRT